MVVKLESDLTRSVAASSVGSSLDWLDGQWVKLIRARGEWDEVDEWFSGRVLCVSGDDAYVMDHVTGLKCWGHLESFSASTGSRTGSRSCAIRS